jgi:putative CocE/NonD family hydrolase
MKHYFYILLVIFSFNLFASEEKPDFSKDKVELILSPLEIKIVADLAKELNTRDYNSYNIHSALAIALIANNFNKSDELLNTLKQSSSKLNPWVTPLYYFQYSTYLAANRLHKEEKRSFDTAFKSKFKAFVNSFDKQYVNYIIDYYQRPSHIALSNVKSSLQAINIKDESNTKNKIQAVQSYFQWILANKTSQIAKKVLNDYQKRHLHLESSLISLPNGDNLEVQIYLPANASNSAKKLPTILVYNLYAKGWNIDNKAIEAAMRGYAGVVVYPRGKGKSSGKIEPFLTEAKDGYHIIDWISNQSWSNQQVGMLGGSYLGFAQWAVTKRLHPALKTIVPSAAVVPGFNDNLTENYILSAEALPWYHLVTNNKTMDFDIYYNRKWSDVYKNSFNSGLSFEEFDSLWPLSNNTYSNWLSHQGNNSYWQQYIPDKEEFSKLNIPILATTGYFDHAQLGTWYYAKQHYENNQEAQHYIVIGPYSHIGANSMPANNVQGYDIDKSAHININGLIFDWFDYIFFNKDKPSILKNDVNYHVMNTNKWSHDSFDNYNKGKPLNLYLTQVNESNVLSVKLPVSTKAKFVEQIIDFNDRTSSINLLETPALSKSIKSDNTLIFESEVFTKGVELSGHLSGQFQISINKLDVDLVAVLFEELPSGEYVKLSHYKARGSHFRGGKKRKLFTPNEKSKVNIKNTPFFSKKLQNGSKLVLVVTALKSKTNQINYGTLAPINKQSIKDAKVPLSIKWHKDSFITVILKK